MDFSVIFKDLNKLIEVSKSQIPVEMQAKVNQFQKKAESMFKGLDLENPNSIDILNEKIAELKELQNGIANHK